jgi:Bacterial SH3 domain
LARIDDRRRPGYPGLALALVPGEHPLLARRINYFESPRFRGYFDPHPNHPPPPTLAELAQRKDDKGSGLQPPPAAALRDRLIGIFRLLFRYGFFTVRGAFRVAATLVGIAIGVSALGMVGAVVYGFIAGLHEQAAATAPQNPAPATDTPAPPVSPPKAAPDSTDNNASTAPARSPAYQRGATDWNSLQQWFNAQTADRHAGAEYWAANRHVPDHASCNDAAARFGGDRSEFVAGCLDATRRLDPIDELRKDPDYRAGFSDAANPAPPSSQSESAFASGLERYAIVSTINLNLRTGPGPQYGSVAVLPQGTKVKIVGDADDGWKELEVQRADGQDLHGFANGTFLTRAPAR